jgi:F0F1-type ATP synthase assembly protein I
VQIIVFIPTLVFAAIVMRSGCNRTTSLTFVLAEISSSLAILLIFQLPFSLLKHGGGFFSPLFDAILGGLSLGGAVAATVRRYQGDNNQCSNPVRQSIS